MTSKNSSIFFPDGLMLETSQPQDNYFISHWFICQQKFSVTGALLFTRKYFLNCLF